MVRQATQVLIYKLQACIVCHQLGGLRRHQPAEHNLQLCSLSKPHLQFLIDPDAPSASNITPSSVLPAQDTSSASLFAAAVIKGILVTIRYKFAKVSIPGMFITI